MLLSEAKLERDIARHVAECERCEVGTCEIPDMIESAFWHAVNQKIDTEREEGRRV